jgi:hypothetical protein
MASKTGSFNTGSGFTDVVVSGLGFDPTLVFFIWCGIDSGGDSSSGGRGVFGFGWCHGTALGDQGSICGRQEDGVTASDADTLWGPGYCVSMPNDLGVDGLLTLKSFDTGGFTLQVIQSFDDQTLECYYIACDDIAASDLSSGEWRGTLNTTGLESVTGVGFQPTALMTFGNIGGLVGAGSQGIPTLYQEIGAANSAANWVVAHNTRENATAAGEQTSYANALHAVLRTSSVGTPAVRAVIDSFDADGFTYDMVANIGVILEKHQYLCFNHAQVVPGNFTTRTDTTQFSVTGLGFQPTAVLFFTHGAPASADGVNKLEQRMSYGFAASPTDRRAVTIFSNDDATTQVWRAQASDCCLLMGSAAETVNAKMDLVSMDADGFTLVMDDADTVESFVGYLAIGGPGGGGGGSTGYLASTGNKSIMGSFGMGF